MSLPLVFSVCGCAPGGPVSPVEASPLPRDQEMYALSVCLLVCFSVSFRLVVISALRWLSLANACRGGPVSCRCCWGPGVEEAGVTCILLLCS